MSWSSWTGGRGLRGSVISLVRATTDRVLQDINQDIAPTEPVAVDEPSSPRSPGLSITTPTTNLPRDGPASPTTEKRDGLLGLPENFLRVAAARWPHRTGARSLQRAAGQDAYEKLLEGEIDAEDEEQLHLDVERSSVDGLEELYMPEHGIDEASLRAALMRLLHAWSVRHGAGAYCQGQNFVAMLLLAVMFHGAVSVWRRGGLDMEGGNSPSSPSTAAKISEDDLRRAEESAFWTFAAVMERILPSDFYSHPGMAGLQRDVRCLYQLFLLQRRAGRLPSPSSSEERPIGNEEWRDILRLAAYRWFVPCYVNCLPLPTLLIYWDKLFLRLPEPVPGPVTPNAATTPANEPLCAVHLQLALALIRATLEEAGDIVSSTERPEEGLGLGFDRLLRGALGHSDGHALVASAMRFEVTPRQLRFLRSHLVDEPAPKIAAQTGRPREPTLNGLEMAALRLMMSRKSESLPLWLLRQALLLNPPQPLPLAAVSRVRAGYYPRFVSTCALTFCAFALWTSRAVLTSGRG